MTETTPNNPLGSAPLTGLITRFAIPSIISMLVSAIYNITDQIFIGNVIGMYGNAATNVVFPLVGLSIAGLVLLIIKCKQLVWKNTDAQLPKGTAFRTVYLNWGMGLFVALCVIFMVIALFI